MPSTRQIIFLAVILLSSCAAPTQQATVIPQTSEVLTPTPTSMPASIPTSTNTPEPTLPSYGVIDPNVGEKLQASGIVIPEELKNPEYKLDLATEYQKTNWGNAYGIDIPITVIPEKGIAYGKYHIKGIGATQEAWDEYAKQHIKYMWIHYREYGNEADRDITLEQYVELLKAGRGGFEIPQYNPKTGFFDLKAKVNSVAGFTRIISDNTYKELSLKGTTEDSALFFVDKNGMVWIIRNDLEYAIEPWLDSDVNGDKISSLTNDLTLANSTMVSGSVFLGRTSTFCLSTDNSNTTCVRDGIKIEKKYSDESDWLVDAYKKWLAEYKAGDHDAQRPVWVEHR
ncbi:MAG: hypothetical protein HS124_10345 [Anaerolineales bacterium]|nr:hypothetical protein [Anaerolineales bacterium]MCL4259853.1 hypothetical protein [Anaerolineales bacterium]